MRLLLDEDSLGNVFVRMLREAGHDVETVVEIGMAGMCDHDVFAHAKHTRRVILTRNVRDYIGLHQADAVHFGILAGYQYADRAKNMSYKQVVAAIGKIEASQWKLQGEFVALNSWL